MLTNLPQLFLLLSGCMFEIDSITFGIWSLSFGLSLLALWPPRPVYGILGGYDYMELISHWPLGPGIHMPYFSDPLFSGFPVRFCQEEALERHWRQEEERRDSCLTSNPRGLPMAPKHVCHQGSLPAHLGSKPWEFPKSQNKFATGGKSVGSKIWNWKIKMNKSCIYCLWKVNLANLSTTRQL